MSKYKHVNNPLFNFLPVELKGFDSLAELALDMRWSWNHASDGLWQELDSSLWELTHNPWLVIKTVSRDQLERKLADNSSEKSLTTFCSQRKKLRRLLRGFRKIITSRI